jgi:hypothetical protein
MNRNFALAAIVVAFAATTAWDIVVADSASAAAIDNAINFSATSN